MTALNSTPAPNRPTGQRLRELRQKSGLSQMELALRAGISQRHMSCIETGRARPGAATLHSLLETLQVPLEQRNAVFLAAGLAPRYLASPLTAPALQGVRTAIDHLLRANEPAPAILLDSQWNVLAVNRGTLALFSLLGLPDSQALGLNLLRTLLEPGGFGDLLSNAEEIRHIVWQRASREAHDNPELLHLLQSLRAPQTHGPTTASLPPLILTQIPSAQGELSFLSTFTTFGMPQDITVASLRIEHLVPADTLTWQVMTDACASKPATLPT